MAIQPPHQLKAPLTSLNKSECDWSHLVIPNQQWYFQVQSFFGKYLYANNLIHMLLPSRDIIDQRILQFD